MTSTSNQPEFVFRFNLNDLETSESADSDPLIDMLKHFLIDIQRIGYLCCNGERVHIDGFVLNNEQHRVHELKLSPGNGHES